MRLLARVWLSFGIVCWVGCVGTSSGLDGGVHIVVPSDGGLGEVTILDPNNCPERVRALGDGPVNLRCRAAEVVVAGMWCVVWEVDETDRSRMQAAMQEFGEVGLMFEGRRIAWISEGRVPESKVAQFPTLDESGAKSLADRITGRR